MPSFRPLKPSSANTINFDPQNGDWRLLREFLAAYQPSSFHRQDFVHKAMTLTLLHPYDAFALPFERHPALCECTSLDGLAHRLWDVDSIDQ